MFTTTYQWCVIFCILIILIILHIHNILDYDYLLSKILNLNYVATLAKKN